VKTIIIGAGPAGLTAAYQLSKETSEVVVFEADACVGGLARSIRLWDQTVDLGPHRFFSRDRRTNELWLEVVGRDYAMVNRQTRILYRGELFQYPLEAFDALAKLGSVEALKCLGSYAREWVRSTPRNVSFEDWVRHRFGRRLFELFFKTYSEKLWGIPCHELDADFAAQRIKKLSLSEAVKSALFPENRKKHRTLVDEFAYPLGGTGSVYERMAEATRRRGGKVCLKAPVKRVLTEAGVVTGVELVSGERLACNQVISTMPLTLLVMQLDGAPPEVVTACRSLEFRNTILVFLEVLNENPFPDNWIYVHSPELRFGRVTNFRNWVPQLHDANPNAILAMEYWCDANDGFWKKDEQAITALAREEIVKAGLVSRANKLGRSFVFRIPRCYPVYRCGYQEHVDVIKEHLKTISGLQVIGRYGSFKYNNQDHSILMGCLAAENVLRQENHDLWQVNTDDAYQEASAITATGLTVESL
jgi:protoporphyrinogen oxidase